MKQSWLSYLRVVALTLAFCGYFPLAQAQSSNPLPDYVVEKFGEAPEVPAGPLSPALQSAARIAFIDSTTLSTWNKNQQQALTAIEESGDPRLAWIISDMLRFVPSRRSHKALSEACLLYTSPSPRDATLSRMPSSA